MWEDIPQNIGRVVEAYYDPENLERIFLENKVPNSAEYLLNVFNCIFWPALLLAVPILGFWLYLAYSWRQFRKEQGKSLFGVC